ncbi:MAG: helix-turn-helix domain-containing protein [Terriglobales bacterium]
MQNSPSPLLDLYQSPEFQLQWDNQVAYHISDNLLHLRLFRGMSQAEVAANAQTSQPAVARVESGDANVTLSTLQRLVEALQGRFLVSIEPAECPALRLAHWWDRGLMFSSCTKLQLKGIVVNHDDQGEQVVAGWESATATLPLRGGFEEVQTTTKMLGDGMGVA